MITNLQAEIDIITESIAFCHETNYYPSTYMGLINRYTEIINKHMKVFAKTFT